MRHSSFRIIGSILFAVVALGLAALGGNSNLQERWIASPSTFQPGIATHETRADPQDVLQVATESENGAGIETMSSAPPTRSSFMANWERIIAAQGYLLDVSTNESFSDYVDGYHDLDVGNVKGRVVTGLNSGTTYYYRVRAYTSSGPGSYSEAMPATTVPTTGLNIHATFDSSITGNPNAAAIEAMINRAISIYESLFRDPITIEILFRYGTTAPNGTPLPQGTVSQSLTAVYTAPWNLYISELRADATTSNDNLAIASLPGSALSTNIVAASANARVVGGTRPQSCLQTAPSAPAGPMTGSLRSTLLFRFSSPDLLTRATSMHSGSLSMKWTRSWVSVRVSAGLATIFTPRTCSVGLRLATEISVPPGHAFSGSTAARPTS